MRPVSLAFVTTLAQMSKSETALASPETVLCESRCYCVSITLPIVRLFKSHWRDIADGFEQPPIVEPIHPLVACGDKDLSIPTALQQDVISLGFATVGPIFLFPPSSWGLLAFIP
jgi:hypothetical protein